MGIPFRVRILTTHLLSPLTLNSPQSRTPIDPGKELFKEPVKEP